MKERNIHFWYFKDSHVNAYKDVVLNYLKENSKNFEEIGRPFVIVDFYNMEKRKNPTNHLFLNDPCWDEGKLEQVCNYVLSKDRRFVPLEVSCSNKDDYEMIEGILNQNYGDKGKLSNGFLGLGKLVNIKKINARTVKETTFGNYVQF